MMTNYPVTFVITFVIIGASGISLRLPETFSSQNVHNQLELRGAPEAPLF